jgi:hypothetical protein
MDPMRRAKKVVSRLAVVYAVLSIFMLLISLIVDDDYFAFGVQVLFSPIVGYLLATVGRIDTTIPVDWALFLQLVINALWCFAFVWVVGRVLLWVFGSAWLAYKGRHKKPTD